MRAAYQGVPGAFSHEACRAKLPEHEAIAFDSFDAVFEAVRGGVCDAAFLPMENSIAGPVPGVADRLPLADLRVIAEHEWPIRLALMALPGVDLARIRLVRSHPVALKQCAGSLARLGLEPEPAFDTAGAARDLARTGERDVAAVASRAACELYGLVVLRDDVQDAADNRTRFVVVARA